ncbi:MAG: hypothetical protein HY076_05805 [Candidatus Eisenbacteria bacterium]|uniref:Uncharacterized protein n=1 Tax=Eiseniibacteriota bacterium TaxID=2212470 RepID=A0A9D6QMH4_UNCEI|nr:hypothetical protein [Candidatus Eisenbacteria bacterium]MBI3539768.1 hypothetical protein [Candidatus Eisenbacteria bacterium]
MTMRIAALLSLALGATGLAGFLTLAGIGPLASPEAHHLRAMKDRLEAPAALEPITFAVMGALPHGEAMSAYAPIERRGVTLEGYIEGMLTSSDGDIHLEVAATDSVPSWPNERYVTAEIPARWRRGSATWQFEPLAALFRPIGSGDTRWDRRARRVRLHGWLLYDVQYDTPHTMTIGRTTGWEIHPVTGIDVWDPASGRFTAYAR